MYVGSEALRSLSGKQGATDALRSAVRSKPLAASHVEHCFTVWLGHQCPAEHRHAHKLDIRAASHALGIYLHE